MPPTVPFALPSEVSPFAGKSLQGTVIRALWGQQRARRPFHNREKYCDNGDTAFACRQNVTPAPDRVRSRACGRLSASLQALWPQNQGELFRYILLLCVREHCSRVALLGFPPSGSAVRLPGGGCRAGDGCSTPRPARAVVLARGRVRSLFRWTGRVPTRAEGPPW